MKNSKKLKLILQILICILIILIGIVGIYTKQSNMYKNLLPKYSLGSDLKGATILEFEVDDTKETVYYDKDGKEVDATTVTKENEKDYEKKEIPVNAEEKLNLDNYNETIEIMEKRLKLLGTKQYQIDIEKETGKIVITVEDDYIEDVETFLPMEGKLQLIDSNTEDVIIDYTDFNSAEASYASLIKETRIYMSLKLNDTGLEKIKDIDKYKVVEASEKADDESKEAAKESKLIVKFDSNTIAEVSYDDILLSGKTVRLTTASGLTSDSEITSELNVNYLVANLATMGKLPVIYNLTAEEFVKNDISNAINYIIISLIAMIALVSIVLIFKYRAKGLLAVLGFTANISIFLIIIRLTTVQVSLNGFAGMFGLVLLNMFLINNILKNIKNNDKIFTENIKRAYLDTLDAIVTILIIFIVFAFSRMTVINSMGLLLFWGWLITVFGNLCITVPMLAITTKK